MNLFNILNEYNEYFELFFVFFAITGTAFVINIIQFIFSSLYNCFKSTTHKKSETTQTISSNMYRDIVESVLYNKYCTYKELESFVLPKRGDYVQIKGSDRWYDGIDQITNIISSDTDPEDTRYNISMFKKYNPDFGNDVPRSVFKEKDRTFFSVLTDQEIEDYGLMGEDYQWNRGYIGGNY